MEQPVFEIKPAYPRFHDFISPQTRIEAAEQDEKQIIIWSCFQHALNSFFPKPITTTDAAWNYDSNIPSWCAQTASLDLDCPPEQRTDNHDVAFSGRFPEATSQQAIIPLLDVQGANSLKRRA